MNLQKDLTLLKFYSITLNTGMNTVIEDFIEALVLENLYFDMSFMEKKKYQSLDALMSGRQNTLPAGRQGILRL
jgi:hypothetical protein